MNATELPRIPRALRDRPTYHGMAVPANVMIDARGVPDFATIDEVMAARLIGIQHCALCAKRMRSPFAFIGGPQSIERSLFRDGPMHEECARYAMSVCPFVTGAHRQYRRLGVGVDRHPDWQIVAHPVAPEPDRMGLVFARVYRRIAPSVVEALDVLGEPEWV